MSRKLIKQKPAPRVTNEMLATGIKGLKLDVAGLKTDVADVKAIVTNAGLNGHTDALKTFLDGKAEEMKREQAWNVVRAELGGWFSWIRIPERGLKLFVAAAIGATGWAIINHILAIWPTAPTHH